jgi:hypothetical protein
MGIRPHPDAVFQHWHRQERGEADSGSSPLEGWGFYFACEQCPGAWRKKRFVDAQTVADAANPPAALDHRCFCRGRITRLSRDDARFSHVYSSSGNITSGKISTEWLDREVTRKLGYFLVDDCGRDWALADKIIAEESLPVVVAM